MSNLLVLKTNVCELRMVVEFLKGGGVCLYNPGAMAIPSKATGMSIQNLVTSRELEVMVALLSIFSGTWLPSTESTRHPWRESDREPASRRNEDALTVKAIFSDNL